MTDPITPAPGASPEELKALVSRCVRHCMRWIEGPPYPHREKALLGDVTREIETFVAALTAAPPLREEAIRREERRRCAYEVQKEAEIAESLNDRVGALRLWKAADRLAPRPSAGEREG